MVMSPKHISAMTQEVSGRSLIAKIQVRSQANQCAIWDGLSNLGHVFIRVLQFILTVSLHQFSIYRRRYTIRVAGLKNFGRCTFKRHLRKQPCNNKIKLLSLMWRLLISVILLQQVRLLVMSLLSLNAFHDQPRVHWYCLNIVLTCKLCETRCITPCNTNSQLGGSLNKTFLYPTFLKRWPRTPQATKCTVNKHTGK
jgi:hypothetical protein